MEHSTFATGSSLNTEEVGNRGRNAGAYSSKKLSGRAHLEVALEHNTRELFAKRGPYGGIKADKVRDNYMLFGPETTAAAMEIADNFVSSADTGGRKLREDAVWGIELVFTVSSGSNIDFRQYFEDCVRWAQEEFKVPMLSAAVHLDQGVPHCHVILVPLIDGKMNGGWLHGHPAKLSARLSRFYAQVGQRYGFIRPRSRQKLPAEQRNTLFQRCADFLSASSTLTGKQMAALLEPFKRNPLSLAECFGVVSKGLRIEQGSMIDLLTSPAGA